MLIGMGADSEGRAIINTETKEVFRFDKSWRIESKGKKPVDMDYFMDEYYDDEFNRTFAWHNKPNMSLRYNSIDGRFKYASIRHMVPGDVDMYYIGDSAYSLHDFNKMWKEDK